MIIMDGFLNSASQNSAPPRNPVSKSFKQKKKILLQKYMFAAIYIVLYCGLWIYCLHVAWQATTSFVIL